MAGCWVADRPAVAPRARHRGLCRSRLIRIGWRRRRQDGAGGSAGQHKYRLAVIPKGTTHEFWKSVHYGAVQAGDEFGAEILWLGPLHGARHATVRSTSCKTSSPSGSTASCWHRSIRRPWSRRSRKPARKEFRSSFSTADWTKRASADPEAVVSYVATDNHHGGELAADEIARRLPERGNVVLLRYMVGSQSTLEREDGFLDGLGEVSAPEASVVRSIQRRHAAIGPRQSPADARQIWRRNRRPVRRLRAEHRRHAQGPGRNRAGRQGRLYRLRSQRADRRRPWPRTKCRASSCRIRSAWAIWPSRRWSSISTARKSKSGSALAR